MRGGKPLPRPHLCRPPAHQKLANQTAALKVGEGTFEGVGVGPMIDARARGEFNELVTDALQKGARVVCGGSLIAGDGYVYTPTVLAKRGGPTAAAITIAFTAPSPGLTPVLIGIGMDQVSYVTLNPPTVILNKSKPETAFQEAVTFQAAPVRIAQGVLDAVAGGLPAPPQETIVLFSLWVDPAAANETVARRNARTATFKAVQEAVKGCSEQVRQDLVAKKDDVTHPFYWGH